MAQSGIKREMKEMLRRTMAAFAYSPLPPFISIIIPVPGEVPREVNLRGEIAIPRLTPPLPWDSGCLRASSVVVRTNMWQNLPRASTTPAKWIGDRTCANNANSPHMRCAINPFGPCDGCTDYEQSES